MSETELALRALRSLVSGVEDLEAAWPKIDLPDWSPLNDLCGFLFATLPLARAALQADTQWETVLTKMRQGPDRYAVLEFEAKELWDAALRLLPEAPVIVELGVCGGKTAVLLCEVARLKGGRYLGVDTWGLESSQDEVADRLDAAGLHDVYTLVQGNTAWVPVPPAIDLLLIDGGHDEANVKPDCERWIPAVVPGGLVAFHDYDQIADLTSAHWAVRHYADLYTGPWAKVAQVNGLLIRQRPR